MLVLARRQGEVIVIGDDIRITVVDANPHRIRLGIEAPPSVRVDRLEIREKKDLERDLTCPAENLETKGQTK